VEEVGVNFMANKDQTKICPKCGKQMEEGYIPNRGIGFKKLQASSPVWISGKPENSFLGYLDLDGKMTFDIITFRCQDCGYLESYSHK